MQAPRKTAIARLLRKQETWAEKLMWRWLRHRRFSAYKFRRQYPLGEYILDFFCLEARLDVEVDGFQHGMPGNRVSDAERDAWLEAHGVKVMRFWNSHLRRESQEIRDAIWRALQERAPHPLPDYCRPGLCKSNKLSARGEETARELAGNSPHPAPLPTGEG
jgi:very-short-patch-repair endonuclease